LDPICRIDTIDGASLALRPTVCASPTFSKGGTTVFVMTVSASQPSTIGTAMILMKCAIFEGAVVGGCVVAGSAVVLMRSSLGGAR
jgi:hypothetical protein